MAAARVTLRPCASVFKTSNSSKTHGSAARPSSTGWLPSKTVVRVSRVMCRALLGSLLGFTRFGMIKQEQPQETSETEQTVKQPVQTPPPSPKPKMESTNFFDVLAFSGPGPERINGRLAMIGFVSAIAVELARGEDLLAQLADGGLPWFVGTAALLSAASLVPLFKGVSAQSRSDGVMTAEAELWNGRFAMLGLVALAFTEYLKGGPLV